MALKSNIKNLNNLKSTLKQLISSNVIIKFLFKVLYVASTLNIQWETVPGVHNSTAVEVLPNVETSLRFHHVQVLNNSTIFQYVHSLPGFLMAMTNFGEPGVVINVINSLHNLKRL